MCKKAILKNGTTLTFVLDCYKNKKICNKAVENYPLTFKFVSKCYKTQKLCDKAVDTHPSSIYWLLNAKRLKKCVIKQSIDIFLYFVLLQIKKK